MGGNGVADRDGLVHHLLVDAEAAGGVDDDDVDPALAGELDARAGDLDRVAHPVAGLGRPHLHTGALADDLQLLDGVGALQVGGDQHDGLALLAQPLAEFARQRGLARALQARQHEHRRPALGENQFPRLPAEDLHQFGVDDGDDLLARVEGLRARGAVGLLAHTRGELADDGQRHVGVDEGAPDLGDRLVDVGLGQHAP